MKILPKDHENGRRKRRKQPTGEPGIKWTDTIQTAEEPLSKPNNCLQEYIICLAETKGRRQNKQCLYKLRKTSNRCPAKLECSVLSSAILSCWAAHLQHFHMLLVGWTSRGLAGVCLHASINITKDYTSSSTLWRDPSHCSCCDDCLMALSQPDPLGITAA